MQTLPGKSFYMTLKRKKKTNKYAPDFMTALLGEQNWPPIPLSCLLAGRDTPRFKCATVQPFTNLLLIPLILIQIAYIENADKPEDVTSAQIHDRVQMK